MKRYLGIITLIAVCFCMSLAAKTPTYVGYKKCRGCHRGKRRDHVSDKWEISKHRKAFDLLSKEEQKNPVCLQCHTTGYGRMPNGAFLEGVQCEECHGPGSEYKSGKIMNSRRYEIKRDEQRKQAVDAGLWLPTMKTCKRCHRTKLSDYEKLLPDERPRQKQ